jgi:hypothetical protein
MALSRKKATTIALDPEDDRLLSSHNVQFPMSHVLENNLDVKVDPTSMASMMRVFPPLQALKASPSREA